LAEIAAIAAVAFTVIWPVVPLPALPPEPPPLPPPEPPPELPPEPPLELPAEPPPEVPPELPLEPPLELLLELEPVAIPLPDPEQAERTRAAVSSHIDANFIRALRGLANSMAARAITGLVLFHLGNAESDGTSLQFVAVSRPGFQARFT
jgi:hypothetical protein